MKIYSIIVTVIAILALGLAGYLYWQEGTMRQEISELKLTNDNLGRDKALTEQKLNEIKTTLTKIQETTKVFQLAINSFMHAGDLKVLNIGSKEATEVETAIGNMTDKTDRMSAEKDWGDFKTSLNFNPLFSLLKNLINSVDRNISNLGGPENPPQKPID